MDITPEQQAVLAAHGKEFFEHASPWSEWESNHGPRWHCVVCDSEEIASTLEAGYAPRWAVCEAHREFLPLAKHIRAVALEEE